MPLLPYFYDDMENLLFVGNYIVVKREINDNFVLAKIV